MVEVTKDLLYAGEYHLPDGRVFRCAPRDMPHYVRRFKEYVASNPLPVHWEHSDRKKQLTPAEKAQQTVGHGLDAVLSPEGFLETKFQLSYADDLKKLPAVRFVSPTIEWDITDSHGRFWPGPTITEIALTPVPIQTQQKPFKLSRTPGAAPSAAPDMTAPIYLSLAAYRPVQLSGETPMAEENETVVDTEKPEAEAAETDTDTEEVEALAGKLKGALEALADHGIILGNEPPETFIDFLDRLVASCKTKKAAETPGEVDASGTAREEPQEAQGPVMMSGGMMSGGMADIIRENYKLRISNLWARKQISKDIKDKLMKKADGMKTVRLSKNGDVAPSELAYTITAYEQLPENTPAFQRQGKVDLSAANEVDPPAAVLSANDHKKQEEAGAVLGSLANGKPKKKSA